MNNDEPMSGDDMGNSMEFDALLGAYALDAVDGDERRHVDDYLRINPRAAAEVADHREVATMLAFTGMDAPVDVWARIEAEIGLDVDAPPPGPELAKVMALAPPSGDRPSHDDRDVRPSQRRSRPSSWLLGAAAALVIAVGAVGIFTLRDESAGDPIEAAYQSALADDGSLAADLVAEGSEVTAQGVLGDDGLGYVQASELPALSDNQTYQLWGVLGGTGDVVSIGILGPDPDLETFSIDGDVDALAITIEDAPGVISDGNPDGAYVGALS